MKKNDQQPIYPNVACRNPDTYNQILPHRVPPMEETQTKIQYPEQYKNTTEKGLRG